MYKSLFTILLFISCSAQKADKDILIKVSSANEEQSGYVNLSGDTVVAFGQYYYLFTDTVRHFAIVASKEGLIGINKKDEKLFNVYMFDNGPDYYSEGLFRIIVNGKMGFANEKGKIVIEPKYSFAAPFYGGKAKVTFKHRLIGDDEHKEVKSDEWFYINKKAETIKE